MSLVESMMVSEIALNVYIRRMYTFAFRFISSCFCFLHLKSLRKIILPFLVISFSALLVCKIHLRVMYHTEVTKVNVYTCKIFIVRFMMRFVYVELPLAMRVQILYGVH